MASVLASASVTEPTSATESPESGHPDPGQPVDPGQHTTARGFSLLDHGWWPVVVAVWGAVIGAGRLDDNSFLTHVASGRLMLGGTIPHHDLYSWSSEGTPLLIPAWGSSIIYATFDKLGSGAGIRVLMALCCAALMVVLWRLAAPASVLVSRLALVTLAGLFGMQWWNERPQTFGFLLLALALVVVVERKPVWWLGVIFAVFVHLHGSFAVAYPMIGALIFIRVVEERRLGLREIGEVSMMLGGAAVSSLASPYGLDLALFPLEQIQNESISLIVEWKPMALSGLTNITFAVSGVLIIGWLLWCRSWARAAMAAVLVALPFDAIRYVALSAITLIPVVAPTLGRLGTPASVATPTRRRTVQIGSVAAVVVLAGIVFTPSYDLRAYPTAEADRFAAAGWADAPRDELPRIMTHDYVGNFLEWRFGTAVKPWIDDRAEVHPHQTITDYATLFTDDEDYDPVVARHPHDVIVWRSDLGFADWVRDNDDYLIVSDTDEWLTACLRSSGFCDGVGSGR